MINAVWHYFREQPTRFEAFAALIWKMSAGDVTYTMTRPTVDGGRDAYGEYVIGPTDDPIRLDFALEAKCYAPGATSVGVTDTSRLISRLRHRQFGVLVTTSFVARQAYEELREDKHPVVIIAARDIVDILRKHDVATAGDVTTWLERQFPWSEGGASSSARDSGE